MTPAVALFSVVVIAVIATVVLERRRIAAFNKRFPPISDVEFMGLCPPGTNPAVALKVRRILSDQLGVEYERIYPSARIYGDLIAD